MNYYSHISNTKRGRAVRIFYARLNNGWWIASIWSLYDSLWIANLPPEQTEGEADAAARRWCNEN